MDSEVKTIKESFWSIMFFPERIISIKSSDYVLEVGPGSTPHSRSDILLEKNFTSDAEAAKQRGYTSPLQTDKKIIFYDGGTFPFKNKEFDYVICSHVLEHVDDVDFFLKEISRVAKGGYLEYPRIYYDFIYNFPEHVNCLKVKDGQIFWAKKDELNLTIHHHIQDFFYHTLVQGYTRPIDELKEYLFEGFQWQGEIKGQHTKDLKDLLLEASSIQKKSTSQMKMKSRDSFFSVLRKEMGTLLTSTLPQEFGQLNLSYREKWIKQKLSKLPAGWRLLDVGAGESPYKVFCQHLKYVSQDINQYQSHSNTLGLHPNHWKPDHIDIVADIVSIPLKDQSFESVLCTEVLEHLPDPIKALEELARILRKDGLLILTAPMASLTHFAPEHYYSGFNRYFYETHLPRLGFEINELIENGNYFEYLAQEIRRIPEVADRYAQQSVRMVERKACQIVLQMLKRFSVHDSSSQELLNYGFHVLARRV